MCIILVQNLSHRQKKFKAIVNDEESEIGSMKYRLPQSTILGHVLFIIYTLTLQYMLNY